MATTQAERRFETRLLAYHIAVGGAFAVEVIIGGYAVAAAANDHLEGHYSGAFLAWAVCTLAPGLTALVVHRLGARWMQIILSGLAAMLTGAGEITWIWVLVWLCGDARQFCPGAETAHSCHLLHAVIVIGWFLVVLQIVAFYLVFLYCLKRLRQLRDRGDVPPIEMAHF